MSNGSVVSSLYRKGMTHAWTVDEVHQVRTLCEKASLRDSGWLQLQDISEPVDFSKASAFTVTTTHYFRPESIYDKNGFFEGQSLVSFPRGNRTLKHCSIDLTAETYWTPLGPYKAWNVPQLAVWKLSEFLRAHEMLEDLKLQNMSLVGSDENFLDLESTLREHPSLKRVDCLGVQAHDGMEVRFYSDCLSHVAVLIIDNTLPSVDAMEGLLGPNSQVQSLTLGGEAGTYFLCNLINPEHTNITLQELALSGASITRGASQTILAKLTKLRGLKRLLVEFEDTNDVVEAAPGLALLPSLRSLIVLLNISNNPLFLAASSMRRDSNEAWAKTVDKTTVQQVLQVTDCIEALGRQSQSLKSLHVQCFHAVPEHLVAGYLNPAPYDGISQANMEYNSAPISSLVTSLAAHNVHAKFAGEDSGVELKAKHVRMLYDHFCNKNNDATYYYLLQTLVPQHSASFLLENGQQSKKSA